MAQTIEALKKQKDNAGKFILPALPYSPTALAPYISEETFSYHYGKHHQAYVANLNKLIDGKPEADKSLEEIITHSEGGIFNNAAQIWNHTFFWHCMSPDGGGKPKGALAKAIERDFGSFENFQDKFSAAATTLFGSGWAWLATDGSGKLEIMPLSNAHTPLTHGKTPLLTLDVWEHAYYIDYRNARPKFVEGFWDVANWEFANKIFGSTQS
jgi:Fe-Mn family superoxide dismutase